MMGVIFAALVATPAFYIDARCAEQAPVSARVGIVFRDTARGDYLVWLEYGSRAGAAPGAAYDVSLGGKPLGTLWIDEIMDNTSAGHITPIAGAPKFSEGAELTLIRKEIQAAVMIPGIHAPGGLPEVPAVPASAAGEKDMRLLSEFLKWSKKPIAPIGALVSRAGFAGLHATGTKTVPSPVFDYDVVDIDPDIANEIKSGYFIEQGDCVHIAPWPESESGGAVIVGEDMKVRYAGASFAVKGRTLLYLEKLVTDFINEKGIAGPAVVSPCKVKPSGN